MYTNVEFKNKITLRLENSVHSLICPIKDGYCQGIKCMSWEKYTDEKYGYCKVIERI